MVKKNETCPCGRSEIYAKCCAKAHQDLYSVKTAEDLMRSRYVAFTMANGDYLLESHHSSKRPFEQKKQIELWAKSVKWVKLEIIKVDGGSEVEAEGTVEFKAHLYENRIKKVMHERSTFIRENGHWVYYDAV